MRRLFVVFLALLVLVCVAYTVYWNVMASRSGEWVAYWAAPTPGKAWSGTYSATETSGFPFSLDITISDPAVSWQGSGGEAIWQGPELIAKFKPWTLASFSFDLPSQQTVIIDDGYLLRMIRIMMESGTARIAMTDDRATALMARFEGVSAIHQQNQVPLTADLLEIDVREAEGGAAHDAYLLATGVGLPVGLMPPFFQSEVPSAAATLRLWGELPGHGSLASQLEAWRVAGGIIEIQALDVDWPPLDIEAEGTASLDTQLRPIGAFRADVVGYRELLNAMEEMGELERGQAMVAGTALDIMAATGDDGSKRLAVDISIQHGLLSVGPIRVMEVPPVITPEVGF